MRYLIIRLFFVFFILTVSGCATFYRDSIALPISQSEQAWSRAHSFLVDHFMYDPFLTTDYVMFSDKNRNFVVSREYTENSIIIKASHFRCRIKGDTYVERNWKIDDKGYFFYYDRYGNAIYGGFTNIHPEKQRVKDPLIESLFDYIKKGK